MKYLLLISYLIAYVNVKAYDIIPEHARGGLAWKEYLMEESRYNSHLLGASLESNTIVGHFYQILDVILQYFNEISYR